MKTYSFEKLECWQKARELAVLVYKITINFPADEKFGMVSQMRRCAISIASNIAEGTSRISKKDQAHFSVISYGSSIELLNDCIIVKDLNYITEESYLLIREKLEYVTYLISALRKSQQINPKPSKP